MICFPPDLLPLQEPRDNPGGAGHAERGLHAGHRGALPHLPRAKDLRLPVPALEAQVHQISNNSLIIHVFRVEYQTTI